MRDGRISFYGFDGTGTPVVVPAADSEPVNADQVGGILAATGNFDDPKRPPASGPAITRARYAGYRLLVLRGPKGVLAAVYPEDREAPPLEVLHRMLQRLEDRLPLRPLAAGAVDFTRDRDMQRILRRGRRDESTGSG